MNIRYKRNARQSYMLLSGELQEESYETHMIEHNHIEALLSGHRTQVEGEAVFWFDISGKKSLADFFEQEGISAATIRIWLEEMEEALCISEQYLLSAQKFILSPDTVFMAQDRHDWHMFLCYAPICHNSFREGLTAIAEYLISHVQKEDMESVNVCYQLYEKVVSTDASLQDLLCILETYNASFLSESKDDNLFPIVADDEPEEEDDWQSYILEGEDEETFWPEVSERPSLWKRFFSKGAVDADKKSSQKTGQKLAQKQKKERLKKRSKGQLEEMEDFIYDPTPFELPLESDIEEEALEGATTFLSLNDITQGRLIYKGSGNMDDIVVANTPFTIGSRPTGNDGVIALPGISRMHARITLEDGDYYIEDLHSKNGTYINDEIIGYHERVLLKKEDWVRFADVLYQFY